MDTMEEPAPLLPEKATARLLGVSPATLIANRFRGQPLLPYVRVGKRAIRYRPTDIRDYIDRNIEPASLTKAKA
jgi:hypothetical protein